MNRAVRSFSLGRRGEEQWERVEAALALDRERGRGRVLMVAADSREVRDEIRRRLRSLATRLEVITPSGEIARRIREVAARVAEDDEAGLPVAWIEAPGGAPAPEEDEQWLGALAELNLRRDWLQAEGACHVVLVGPRSINELVRRQAPDLAAFLGTATLLLDDTLETLTDRPYDLTWMHLSDLHLKSKDWQQDDVLEALVRDLPGLLEKCEVRPELLFVTGDVAHSGQRPQYDAAFEFLERVVGVLGIDRHQRVFMVPGNHDVDRGSIGPIVQGDLESLLSLSSDELRNETGRRLEDRDEFSAYGKRLTEWCAFTKRFLGPTRGVEHQRPWRSDIVEISGLRLGILSLCTAWASERNEEDGTLLLGESQLARLLRQIDAEDVQITFALMHHPTDSLHLKERSAIRSRLRDVDIVLHGHTHESRSTLQVGSRSTTAMLEVGAAYAGLEQDRFHGFSIGRLRSDPAQLEVNHFTWSTDEHHWHVNAKKGNDGVWAQEFHPRRVVSSAPTSARPRDDEATSDEVLAQRLRLAARNVYAAFDLGGLTTTSRSMKLDEIFVPLQVRSWDRIGGLAEDYEPDEDEEAEQDFHDGRGLKDLGWLEAMLDAGERFIVQGGPGSGKSTLCKHLAVSQASQEDGRVPLLLTVRDWLAEGAREGLLDMAAREATTRLSVQTDAAALDRLCDRGRVLLLVDGLDEAADLATRRQFRDRVHGFATSRPDVPILVTSRHAGYDHVPLDHWSFEELDVVPLDDDDIELFVSRWYGAVVRLDDDERLRRRADLLDALRREPRLQELARNPLLLTLIASIHSSEGRLPGNRAMLYEAVVEQLLCVRPTERGSDPPLLVTENRPLYWTEQRTMLERIALHAQEQRAGSTNGTEHAGIPFRRREFEDLLFDQLQQHWPNRTRHEHLDLARRWLEWLTTHSGLVREIHAGKFDFIHLSVLEYLAGQALLDTKLREDPASIVEFCDRPPWREPLLLALTSRASERSVAESIVKHLVALVIDEGERHQECLRLLLRLLHDGVDVGPDVCKDSLDAIDRAVRGSVDGWRDLLHGPSLPLRGPHAKATKEWLSERLSTVAPSNLQEVLLLAADNDVPPELVETCFDARPDGETSSVALLDFGTHPFAEIGRRRAARDARLDWALHTPPTLVVQNALVNGRYPIAHVWVPALIIRCAWLATQIFDIEFGRDEPGPPASTTWASPPDTVVSVRLLPALHGPSNAATDSFRLPYPELSRALATWLGKTFIEMFTEDEFTRELYEAFRYFSSMSANERSFFISSDRAHLRSGFNGWRSYPKSSPVLARIRDLSEGFTPSASTPPPAYQSSSASSHPDDIDRARLLSMFAENHAAQLLSVYINGTLTSVELAQLRLENRWLHLFFTPLVDHLTASASLSERPDLHALLMTLGLAQYQTTWQWPDCPHWRAWFSSPVPDHWLPAHLWHLVRSIQDPSDPAHRRHADAALDRADWPLLAEALRAHTLVHVTSETLARFGHASEPSD